MDDLSSASSSSSLSSNSNISHGDGRVEMDYIIAAVMSTFAANAAQENPDLGADNSDLGTIRKTMVSRRSPPSKPMIRAMDGSIRTMTPQDST